MAILRKVKERETFDVAFGTFYEPGKCIMYHYTPSYLTDIDEIKKSMSKINSCTNAEDEKTFYHFFIMADSELDVNVDDSTKIVADNNKFADVAHDISILIFNLGYQSVVTVNRFNNLLIASYVVDTDALFGPNPINNVDCLNKVLETYILAAHSNLKWYDFE